MTLPREKLTDILVTARGYMGKEAGARLLGVNLEGPFIAPAKRRSKRRLHSPGHRGGMERPV